MSNPIRVDISGGSQEENLYVSSVVERSLTQTGFTHIENTINSIPKTDDEVNSILDFARRANPKLFSIPIIIGEPEEPIAEETEQPDIAGDELDPEDD